MTTPAEATQIPKTVWLMWWQGLDNAPELVRRCYASWQHHNPGWRVVFLDEANFRDYVDIDDILASGNTFKLQAMSDIIRIYLVSRHGGVWVDATCFCCRPLDEWLAEHAVPGFFAFDRPTKSRLLDVWFLASSAEGFLAARFMETVRRYWLSNRGLKLRPSKTFFDRAIRTLMTQTVWTTQFWFSYPVRKWMKIYPYLWAPFLFAQLLRADPRCRQTWRDVKKIGADVPHRLQRVGLSSPLTEEVKAEIDSRRSPVYKLDWRHDPAVRNAGDYEGSVLQYLLRSFSEAAPAPPGRSA